MADVEVKDRPDECEAAGLAREPADHLGAAFDLAERPFEQVRASPAPAMAGRVAQMDDERVEVVGETLRGGGVAGPIELADQRQEPLLGVALVDGLIEGLPVDVADALALAFGQLGQQVAHAVNGAVLAVRGRPALLDRLDQPGGAVGDDQHRRPEAAADESRASASQSSWDSRIPSITASSTRSPCSVKPQATRTPSLGPSRRTERKTASKNKAASRMS